MAASVSHEEGQATMDHDGIRANIGQSMFTAVEFPGYVRNTQKALSMIGGTPAVAALGENGFLRLSFRPEDPLAHPIFGDKQHSRAVLLRVSRPRVRPGASPEEAAAATDAAPTVKVVGTVGSVVRFNGLADFQYLPVDTTFSTRDYSCAPSVNLPENAEPSGVAEPLLCLPPLFSRSDEPFDYNYQQHISKAAKQQQQAQVPTISFFASSVPGLHPSTVHQLKQQQQHQQQQHAMDVDGAHAGDGGPQAPTEQQQQQLESQKEGERERDNTAVLQQQQQQALQQVWDLLQQRPIWSAQLLKERAQLPHMQHALPQLCFKFKTGPWRDLLVRRGYDPRSDPSSGAFQAVTYSIPAYWYARMANRMVQAAKQGQRQQQNQQQQQQQSQQQEQAGAALQGSLPAAPPPCDTSLQAICRFQTLPTTRTVALQVCDLEDDEVRGIMRRAGLSSQGNRQQALSHGGRERCTEAHGWLTPADHAALQAAVAGRFQALIHQQQTVPLPGTKQHTTTTPVAPGEASVEGQSTSKQSATGKGRKQQQARKQQQQQQEQQLQAPGSAQVGREETATGRAAAGTRQQQEEQQQQQQQAPVSTQGGREDTAAAGMAALDINGAPPAAGGVASAGTGPYPAMGSTAAPQGPVAAAAAAAAAATGAAVLGTGAAPALGPQGDEVVMHLDVNAAASGAGAADDARQQQQQQQQQQQHDSQEGHAGHALLQQLMARLETAQGSTDAEGGLQDAYDILEDEGIPLRAGSPHMGTEALTPAQLSEQQVLEQEEGGEEVEEEEDEEEGEEEEGDDFGIEESDEYAYLF